MSFVSVNAFDGELNNMLRARSRMASLASFGIGREDHEDQLEVLMQDLAEEEEQEHQVQMSTDAM